MWRIAEMWASVAVSGEARVQRRQQPVVPAVAQQRRDRVAAALHHGQDSGKLRLDDQQPLVLDAAVNDDFAFFLLVPLRLRVAHGVDQALAR
jgi:hypothetical protein